MVFNRDGGYALEVNGGTDRLTGVPGVSLSASGLLVRVNTTGTPVTDNGLATGNPLTVPAGNQTITLDFRATGIAKVLDVEGKVSLTIGGFASLSGDFIFQKLG